MSYGTERLSLRVVSGEHPDAPALVVPGRRPLTFRDLAERAGAETARVPELAELARTGCRVGLVATPSVETVARFFGLADAGVTVVPLHPRGVTGEWRARATAVGCRILLGPDGGVTRLPPPAGDAGAPTAPGPERPLAVLFTSGSTGTPRGVELSRRAFVAAASASAERLGWRTDDRWLCVLPLAHVGGLSILVRSLLAARPVVLHPAFDPAEVAASIDREGVTLASFVPTMVARLLDACPDWRPPPRLRAVLLGGAAGGPELWATALERGLPLLETYGMTETCSQVATAVPGSYPRTMRPLPGFDVRERDGRIEVRGPMLFTRYLPEGAHESPFTPDGWFRTGDAGRLRDDGSLEPLGRSDDTIVTGGENVAPAEIEHLLETHPAVRRASVIGLPDRLWGEIVAAALVSVDGAPVPSEEELRSWLERRLAPFRRPRRFAWVERLPETPTGKVDRREVRRLFE